MSEHPDTLVELTTANNELEAGAVVAELASHGIDAQVFSSATSTMRIYTSQAIRIDVRRSNLEQAAAVVEEFRRKPIVCDWSDVDTGDRSPLSASERAAMVPCCVGCGTELSSGVVAQDSRCPTCGASLAETPPISGSQLQQAREARADRMVKWSLGVVAGFVVVCILYITFGRTG